MAIGKAPISITWGWGVAALSEIVVGTLAQFILGIAFGASVLQADLPWIKFLAGTGDPPDLSRRRRAYATPQPENGGESAKSG